MAFKMTHPDSKQEIQVDAENVAVFESQGWETAPNVKSPAEVDEPKKK
jgi:hypothetical protein